jgi:hypothetical protein
LRITLITLSACALFGAAAGWLYHALNRPAAYKPGEASEDITSALALNLPADAPKPRLADVTTHAGLADFRTFAGARTSQLPEDNGPGVAWGDYDNDGDDDVFLVAAGGAISAPPQTWAASALFQNVGDGTFRRVDAFPETRVIGMAAAWGDYDEDGFLDLVLTGYNTLRLFRNEAGTGRFTADPRFANRPGYWAGAAWGDFDNDRHLDLYVCG